MKGGLRYVARCYGPHYQSPSGSVGSRVLDLYIFDRWNCWAVAFHRVVPLNPRRWGDLVRGRREWRRTFHELNAGTR